MADSALLQALLGLRQSGANTGYGITAQSIAGASPALINPYGSAAGNFGTVLGASLLAGILGGLAKREAAQDTQELYSLARGMRTAAPEQRDAMIGEHPELASYWLALQGMQDEAAAELAAKRQEKLLDLDYETTKAQRLGPIQAQQEAEKAKLLLPIEVDAATQKAEGEALGKARGETQGVGYNPKQEEALDSLRKEFNALPEVKNFSQVEKAATVMNQALQDDSKVSDQELVRYGILMIEPGMAVREGEQSAIANSQNIPDAWKGAAQAALSGKTALGPEVREGLKNLAMRAYEGHKMGYDRALEFYQDQASAKGLDPARLSYIGPSKDTSDVLNAEIPGAGASTIDDTIPPGMKRQRNPVTGETPLVAQ